MIVGFSNERLRRLYVEGEGAEDYTEAVVAAYLRRVRTLEAAADERDLRAQKSLHFEQLKEKRYRDMHSLRINEQWEQWRLIVKVSGAGAEKTVTIHEISKHCEG